MADQGNAGEKPKIIVDDDWKAQARAEKERLATEQAKAGEAAAGASGAAGAAGAGAGAREVPPASFATLVSAIASQALFALGAIADPQTNRRYVNLDLAKHEIDTLKVLEQKTANNLADDEKQLLDRTLYELRSHYVQVAQRLTKL